MSQMPNFPKRALVMIIFIVIIFVVLLGILNSFNILPAYKLFPNQIQAPSTQQNTNVSSQKISCPSIPEFCQSGNGIIKDEKYLGWGSVLASESAIIAAFDGILSSIESTFPKEKDNQTTQKKFITAYLDNSELGLRGTYYFRGSMTKSGKVSKGEQIGVSNGKVISIYDNKALVFSLISGYPKANTPAILNKDSFE